jgi:5'-nucleotidase
MINWNNIDTIFLDLDGTLLDLYYDTYFWLEHLPKRYAERHNLSESAAKDYLIPKIRSLEGTLQWYCLDYWSEELAIEIMDLKEEIAHLITVRPHVEEFLKFLRDLDKPVLLTTNSHAKGLHLKLGRTGLSPYFDTIVSSHDYGVPKEQVRFWECLHQQLPYNRERTLLIDDNHAVLRSAKQYGIGHLLGIALPDSKGTVRVSNEFTILDNFRTIIPPVVPANP